MRPVISVIIPVFNHAHTLERSINSLRGQTYRPLEIIVVDDGSTDNVAGVTKKIALVNAQSDLTLTFLPQTNQGAPAARNNGFKASNGELVIFWDADTIADPRMLETMAQKLLASPDTAYVYSQFKFGWKTMRSGPFSALDLKQSNYIDVTSLIRREALAAIPGPFDIALKRFQDWDLWLTLLEQNKTGLFIPEVLYTKIVQGRKGMSEWLPSFAYRLPWKTAAVKKYEVAREIVLKKHHL